MLAKRATTGAVVLSAHEQGRIQACTRFLRVSIHLLFNVYKIETASRSRRLVFTALLCVLELFTHLVNNILALLGLGLGVVIVEAVLFKTELIENSAPAVRCGKYYHKKQSSWEHELIKALAKYLE